MQDDLLMDKSKAQPQQHQDPNAEAPSTSISSEPPKTEDILINTNSSVPAQNNKEKVPMESPILPGLGYHQPQQEPAGTSLSPSFGNNWSTGTTNTVDDSFFQGITPVNGTMLFQNFPHHVNPVFGGTFSPQIGLAQPQHHQQQQQAQQQQQRRSPVSPNQAPFAQRNAYSHQPIMTSKPSSSSGSSAWNNHQNAAWSTASNPWGGLQPGRDPRRPVGVGVGVPSPLNPISPLKKPFSSNVIAPPKFPRAGPLTPKSWMEDNGFRTDNSNNMLPFQDRNRPYDTFNLHSLENSLMDMIRTDHEPLKGKHYPPSGPPMSIADIMWRNHLAGRMGINFPHPGTDNIMALNTRSYGRRRGRSSLFPFEDGFLDDSHGDQSLTSGLSSPTRCQNGERVERYSRKVFVGGLPPDIDEDEITASFRRFGPLVVDWPHKAESKSYFPPKGYAFLLFQEESSVQALIDACLEEDGKLYLCVSSPTIKDKPVQIRPWNLSDSDFVMDGSQPLDPRKTIFVGGVPRPLRAVELAMIMDRLYGGVCYAGIDTDPELKYPKGAGRVAFSNQQSYIAAISARFVQLQHNDIDKRVEVKPYVLDDQMCDECQGTRCGGKFAPFFCANVTCLQYYCEYCWASIHSRAGREFHKPLVKEGGDRPRHVPFRWN
ncbi:cytoplasmic polyadenylation element-binding protein 3 isoform X1 [Latimeria chalumnae]|uniref:cytoplasmic polyadenylation element-binding protein 3 isoform X1 n=2 Tax=Latimeria chalumnae TaxID=7897 RepID=UPI0003C11E3C|nr:PREDICTED: cytoplasmic polyadenylation element-binding protein 3 isoform X1 [Latimeria chalumnae]XP_005991599.1 PREDICTED: cytoplasmic polyadenylation element-binding protein 3 isoform X1 [Latimeria chalumnae]XP_005991600.1 PREDICTED: cytoplasmic polyadenylation element-binding protein 3 isoform X1 [Latimeria chalumnae]XP_005991601.1 PREDICTED: cytoplasmic polyadenylation element-binding protein 3 isoform X1 [Latimeria chalumnae]XP_005991602.1 PREDICTED: cytoplasmic polyadenylation element-b|eukprot:XP_005991598.1 PREDICTED: cytoplasmic polyadenylation element-binding protein 3 isoform X1 [Latimeria chalumnae]